MKHITYFITFLPLLFFACNSFEQKETKYYYETGELHYVIVQIKPNEYTEKEYDINGQLMFEGGYQITNTDTLPIWVKKYDRNGKLYSSLENNINTAYYNDSTIRYQGNIKNGKLHGSFIGYFPSGKKMCQINYLNGIKDGENISYYESGKIRSKEVYKNGIKSEPDIQYYENGSIEKKVFYTDGKRTKIEYYDSIGVYINSLIGEKEIDLKEGRFYYPK